MEQYLKPNDIGDYNKKEFWDHAFSKYRDEYDWYGSYSDFKKHFDKYMKKSDKILLVGCGNSSMGEKLYDNGYHRVTCIDYSQTVIQTMNKRKGKRESLIYSVMDATKMTFEDGSFDIVIDKACLDAIYAEENEKCKQDATAYSSEVLRVLKKGGVLFTISMSQNFICHHLYQMVKQYSTDVDFIGEPQKSVLTNPLFLFSTKKSESEQGYHFQFDPIFGFLRNLKYDKYISLTTMSEEEVCKHIEDTQFYFNGRNLLRTIHKDCKESVFSLSLTVRNANNDNHQYFFSVWDHPTSNKALPVTSALLIPCGSEKDVAFNSYETISQLIDSVHCDRMIFISRANKKFENEMITEEMVKKDCEPLFECFIPIGGQQSVTIYTPPKSEDAVEVESGTLSMGGKYVIKDKVTGERKGSRQLIFTTNLKAIQSELYYHISGGKKKRRVYEFNHLAFFIHQLMASSLLLCPPLTNEPSILILGLGGGCLPSFFHYHYPNAPITVIDIDSEVIRIAREYFKLDSSIQTFNMDALAFVSQECGKSKYDYIFVDIDAKDLNSSTSFPPMSFLTGKFLEQLKQIQNEEGVVVYNISSSKDGFITTCERQFKKCFKNLYTQKTKDLNVAFIASDRPILSVEELDGKRTETNRTFMVEFNFVEN